jgi:hypothetical protein
MAIKILHWIGIAACVLLIVSCFLPWVHYADINQDFTGFYSYKNEYGRPGKFFVLIGTVTLVFMILPKLWAKRANLFITALGVGYAIKTYILFTSCYNVYCPEKLTGIFLMLVTSVVMLIAAVFPGVKLTETAD